MIEKMKKFFLNFEFAGKKLNVINNQNIIFSIFFLEEIWFVCLQGIDVFLSEFFRSGVKNLFSEGIFQVITHSLNQMSFTMTCITINKKWIVNRAGVFDDRLSGGKSEFVEWSNYKIVKRISWI